MSPIKRIHSRGLYCSPRVTWAFTRTDHRTRFPSRPRYVLRAGCFCPLRPLSGTTKRNTGGTHLHDPGANGTGNAATIERETI